MADADWARHALTHVLVEGRDGLSLNALSGSRRERLFLDYCRGRLGHRLRAHPNRRGPLARALGLGRSTCHPWILDATGGLGRDALLMARLGCRVTVCERNPVIAALIEDALERGRTCAEHVAEAVARVELLGMDACDWLVRLDPGAMPQVIYLDPMYPHRTKSALVKREMRILRAVVGDDADAPALLEAALARRARRVVVKRPKGAPNIGNLAPHHQIVNAASRFDVYVMAR